MDEKKFLSDIMPDFPVAMRRYKEAEKVLDLTYNLPEIDWVRHEIARCYIIGAYHAAVTLTNYMLEHYLKYLLIVSDSGIKLISDISTLEQRFKPHVKRYIKKPLSETLEACREKGLISEDRYRILDGYRKTKRNAFGHANSEQVTRNFRGNVLVASLTGEFETVHAKVAPGSIPFLAGIAVQAVVERDAWPYFQEVDRLITDTIQNILDRK